MYSGLVLTRYSGRLMGAHQKIDRVARRHLAGLMPSSAPFPKITEIIRFEGKNGPDGIKRKSPGKDEPWHFLNPLGDDHDAFLQLLREHYEGLVRSLQETNSTRAAFEAAWLAHAIVDGLTPAHHYPYEQKIDEMRQGGNEARQSIKDKFIFKGDTAAQTALNNFKAYGPRGLLSSHVLFEFGVMFLIRPLRLPDAKPTASDLSEIEELGHGEYFIRRAREVAVHDLYEQYLEKGWTPKLANQIRHKLAPTMAKTVTVIWYAAAREAKICA